ncbi:hypothetical protein BZG36_00737 [Bifiguratus adelaidae]|uniref:Elongation factor 1 alpha-like protein n=1 Tax=Bifiguratus adelaidae TaxID=1938954 RepID=A0A261Y6X1_9FUNG|nr:hypothetical protein BZG36_00737 [Bifiguratus adelaidae]
MTHDTAKLTRSSNTASSPANAAAADMLKAQSDGSKRPASLAYLAAARAGGQAARRPLTSLLSGNGDRNTSSPPKPSNLTNTITSSKPSLASLAKKSGAPSGSLSSLAYRKSPSTSSNPSVSRILPKSQTPQTSLQNLGHAELKTATAVLPRTTKAPEAEQTQSEQPSYEQRTPSEASLSDIKSSSSTPLTPFSAPPSAIACFLFQSLPSRMPNASPQDVEKSIAVRDLEFAVSAIFPKSHRGNTSSSVTPPLIEDREGRAKDKADDSDGPLLPRFTFHTARASKASKETPKSITPTPTKSKPETEPSKAKVADKGLEEGDLEDRIKFDMDALHLNMAPTKKTELTSHPLSRESSYAKSGASTPTRKRIDVLEEYNKRQGKPSLNLVVIGHVDAGKSTLMGHLLYELGQVSERTLKKYEREAQRIGKSSFAYAWILDETGEERSRGITMDIAVNAFETEHRKLTLLDAPGHRDFIPNMISGAAQADVAILVVDAMTGEFEAGFDANGQTKEHALLVRSLGVQQLIVAINKLDLLNWSQTRFDEIVARLGQFLQQAGFRKQKLSFVPVSGLTGENLVKMNAAPLKAWYHGPTLVDLIDAFDPPVRNVEKHFRLGVSDFFKGGIGSGGGVSVAGRIDAGTVQIGDQVMCVPGGELGTVKAVEVNDQSVKWAVAGDTLLMTLSGLDILQLSPGCVLCDPLAPVPVAKLFKAQIVTFDIKIPITLGYPVVVHHQRLDEPAVITKLVAILDKASGEVTKKNPRTIGRSAIATVEITLTNRKIPLEAFMDSKELGRVMLRKGGETVAAGVVVEILED